MIHVGAIYSGTLLERSSTLTHATSAEFCLLVPDGAVQGVQLTNCPRGGDQNDETDSPLSQCVYTRSRRGARDLGGNTANGTGLADIRAKSGEHRHQSNKHLNQEC